MLPHYPDKFDLMLEGKNTQWHKARATAIARMRQLLDKGLRLGAENFDRDTLHDRKWKTCNMAEGSGALR